MRDWGRIILMILRELTVWWRELFGWLLVALGLYLFFLSFLLLTEKYVLEAGPLSVIAIVIFRGGIHMLKVAVAARLCSQARERAVAPPKGTSARS